MFHRSCFALALLAVSVGQTTSLASGIPYHPGPYSPITYDFSGTLNQPIDGSTSFRGSFTFDNGLPPGAGGTTAGAIGLGFAKMAAVGNPTVSMEIGGQTFVFTTPTALVSSGEPGVWIQPNPNPWVWFTFQGQGLLSYPASIGSSQQLWTDANVTIPNKGSQDFLLTTSQNGVSASGQTASMTINLLNTAGNIWAMNPNATSLPLLKLPDFNINQFDLQVALPNGSQETATGSLTKLEPEVATPEPSTIAIFSLLAAGSLIYRHCRRTTGTRACDHPNR